MTGNIGESIANFLLSQKTRQGELFRTRVIGENWPTIDIYAELITNLSQTMFAFFQIKTTELGYTKRNPRRLRVAVELSQLKRLANYNAPSYIIGVDYQSNNIIQSRAYIGTVRGSYNNPLSSFSTINELNEKNLISLWEEIQNFWISNNSLNLKSSYYTNFEL